MTGLALLIALLAPKPLAVTALPTTTPTSFAPPIELSTLGIDQPAPPTRPGTDLSGFQVDVALNGAVYKFVKRFRGGGRRTYARWFARMGRYSEMMLAVLKEEGAPPELIYVCMIESGFDVDAVSHAGAVGPWQFIQSTGQQMELRIDAWVDERRDPVKSTRAAARHLLELHQRFGKWSLAIAAYNAGVGAVHKAIRRANSNDFWRLVEANTLPNEAMKYVPKAMAAMIVGRQAEQGRLLGAVPDKPHRTTIARVPGGLDIRGLAKRAGTSMGTLELLNPELRRGYTPPDGTDYALRVLRSDRERIIRAARSLKKDRPGVFTEHRTRFGERTRDIAKAYGVYSRDIRRVNEMGDDEDPIPGRTILVPTRAKPDPEIAQAELIVGYDPKLKFSYPDRRVAYFPVRWRQSIQAVADFFEVTPGHIALWNNIDADAPLQRGMALRLYLPKTFDHNSAVLVPESRITLVETGTDAAVLAMQRAEMERSGAVRRRKYKIRRGDNLWKIARKYGVTVKAIRAENGFGKKVRLSIGQTIRVPVLASKTPRGKAAKRRAKRGHKKYKVRKGDSMWSIAKRHGVDIDKLRRRNNLRKKPRLKPGMVLIIP